jgi:hypothetical protein
MSETKREAERFIDVPHETVRDAFESLEDLVFDDAASDVERGARTIAVVMLCEHLRQTSKRSHWKIVKDNAADALARFDRDEAFRALKEQP